MPRGRPPCPCTAPPPVVQEVQTKVGLRVGHQLEEGAGILLSGPLAVRGSRLRQMLTGAANPAASLGGYHVRLTSFNSQLICRLFEEVT